jgi:hypothetical protein
MSRSVQPGLSWSSEYIVLNLVTWVWYPGREELFSACSGRGDIVGRECHPESTIAIGCKYWLGFCPSHHLSEQAREDNHRPGWSRVPYQWHTSRPLVPAIVSHCSSPHWPNNLTWRNWLAARVEQRRQGQESASSKNREGVTKWVSVVVPSLPRQALCPRHDVKVTWKYNPEVTRTRTSYCKSPAWCVKYVHDALVVCHLSSWILCLLYHHLSMYICLVSLGLVFLFLVSL